MELTCALVCGCSDNAGLFCHCQIIVDVCAQHLRQANTFWIICCLFDNTFVVVILLDVVLL